MKIECLTVGQLQTNCYLVWDQISKKAIIIDPGDDADYILRKIQDLRLKPKLIIATHGHFDHVLGVTELRLAFQIPFLIHQADLFLLERVYKTTKYFTGLNADPFLPPDWFIKEKDQITFGQEKLEVIETPGHTQGSICLYQKGILFSGDTLFAQGVGRTNPKLSRLPPKTLVYPGHGPETILSDLIY